MVTLRVSLGLSGRQFGRKCGRNGRRITDWESTGQPRADSLREISEATGVSVDWLLGLTGSDDQPQFIDQSRDQLELSEDIAAYVKRELGLASIRLLLPRQPEGERLLALLLDAERRRREALKQHFQGEKATAEALAFRFMHDRFRSAAIRRQMEGSDPAAHAAVADFLEKIRDTARGGTPVVPKAKPSSSKRARGSRKP